MSQSLNIIFAGTPDFAAKHLAALINSHHNVIAVYCPPDKPAGRGKKLTACATKLLAIENNIPVEQPQHFKESDDQDTLIKYQAVKGKPSVIIAHKNKIVTWITTLFFGKSIQGVFLFK